MKITCAAVAASALLLSACVSNQSAPVPSGNVYGASEANSAMSVANCTVTRSDYATIVNDGQDTRGTVNQVIGVGLGAYIGNEIGGNVGGGSGRDIAKAVGTVAGGMAGDRVAGNVNAKRRTATGAEYTVDLGRAGTRKVVQRLNPGEAILPAGSSCTLTGSGSSVRVQRG